MFPDYRLTFDISLVSADDTCFSAK